MSILVIENVKISELPEAWRSKLAVPENARVTIRIEEQAVGGVAVEDDLLFGMWRDREDMADVQAYVGTLRAPRL